MASACQFGRNKPLLAAMTVQGDETGRREQVLAVAEQLVIARGSLNVSLNAIAEELGVSRSLLYVYFDSVPQIIDALFFEQALRLDQLVKQMRDQHSDFRPRMLGLFHGYLQHLVERGHLIHLVLRERHQDSPLQPQSSRLFRRILLIIARDVSCELQLAPRGAFVTLELLAAIPEALARLVRSGAVDVAVAMSTSERLLAAALDAMEVREA